MPYIKRNKPNKPNRKDSFGRRTSDDSKRYNSRRWRKVRQLHLAKEPLCRECQREGKVVAATVVDHKHRVRDGGDFWDPHNFQSLCSTCHNRKSGREAHDNR